MIHDKMMLSFLNSDALNIETPLIGATYNYVRVAINSNKLEKQINHQSVVKYSWISHMGIRFSVALEMVTVVKS